MREKSFLKLNIFGLPSIVVNSSTIGTVSQKCIIEGVDEDRPICHYLSLSKLIRLITESTIFFPKLNLFRCGDPYECILWPPKRYASESFPDLQQWAKTLAFSPVTLPHDSMAQGQIVIGRVRKEIESADISTVRELIKIFEIREWADGVICNCWHLNTEESDAMWKIYSGRLGVAIFTTVKQLVNSIIGFVEADEYEKNTHWFVAPIIYRNESELNDLPQFYVEHPWLLKRRAFEHEKELRIFKELPGGSRKGIGRDVYLDTKSFINKILLSPFNADWENKVVENILKELWENKLNTTPPPIEASRHLNAQQPEARILAKITEINEREENLEVQKALFRLPAKLMLGGRTTHATDEDWILSEIGQLLQIWNQLPNGVAQAVLLEEFREILKFTRNENAAREAWHKLEAVRARIFESNPDGEKVGSEALVSIANYLKKKLK